MKKIVLLIPMMASVAFAQVSTTKSPSRTTVDSSVASSGIRVSIFKPSYEMKIKNKETNKATGEKQTFTGSMDLDRSGTGLSVGYVYIPVRSLGFTANANYIEHVMNDNSANTVRLDGNGTFAFSNFLYAKAGLNFTQFVSANAGKFDGGLGYQAGLGVQVNRNVGFDLTYSASNITSDFSESTYRLKNEMTIQGLEFGINATF